MNIFHDQKLITAKIHGKWIGMGYLKEKSLLDFVKKKKNGKKEFIIKELFPKSFESLFFCLARQSEEGNWNSPRTGMFTYDPLPNVCTIIP